MKALILKNLQNDFLDTGAMPLDGIASVIVEANSEMKKYDLVLAVQKWFPADHHSFAANHPWRKPGQTITVGENEVLLQIIHCVADSFGAALISELDADKINHIIKDEGLGSDSVMEELNGLIQKYKIEEIDVLGPELTIEKKEE